MIDWKQIDGWFTGEDAKAYTHIAWNMPPIARFLEIGAYKGRSTVCMDTIAKDIDRNITIDVIDTFNGDVHIGTANTHEEFIANTKHCNIGRIYPMDTAFAHATITDGYYDAVFIDATHTYKAVLHDIVTYQPKVKKGGIIAGHDIDNPDVYKAVYNQFGRGFHYIGNCWITKP